jgi:ssDNA-binding Zn-finger/Zn-ribbon topoisomerase 1
MSMPTDEEPKLAGKCPDCGAAMTVRKSKRGKTYYSCLGYPDCKFMSWDIPTGEKCPVCSQALVKTARGSVRCSDKDCSYKAKGEKKSLPKVEGIEPPPYLEEPPVYDDYYGQED